MYIRCKYVSFGKQFPKYTVIYGVYIHFWPTLLLAHQTPSIQGHTHQSKNILSMLLFFGISRGGVPLCPHFLYCTCNKGLVGTDCTIEYVSLRLAMHIYGMPYEQQRVLIQQGGSWLTWLTASCVILVRSMPNTHQASSSAVPPFFGSSRGGPTKHLSPGYHTWNEETVQRRHHIISFRWF
jgi:hypothetical protein